jgi:hypothetical protein
MLWQVNESWASRFYKEVQVHRMVQPGLLLQATITAVAFVLKCNEPLKEKKHGWNHFATRECRYNIWYNLVPSFLYYPAIQIGDEKDLWFYKMFEKISL